MHPRPPSYYLPPGAAFQGGGLSCCVAPSNTLPDADHPDLTPCPPNSSVRRTGLAVASGRTLQIRYRQAAIVQVKRPYARCRFANALPAARRWQGRLSGTIRKMPQQAGPAKGRFPMGLRRQRRRVGLRPGQGVRLEPLLPVGIAAFIQAAPAARPASCEPRPHCEPPGRRCAAWRSSPWYCGWSPPCRAAYRRRRTAIRSRQGAGC